MQIILCFFLKEYSLAENTKMPPLSSVTDARDAEQLSKNKVTHILSVHDSARPMLEVRLLICAPVCAVLLGGAAGQAVCALQQQLRVLAVLTRAWPRLGLGLWLGWAGSGVLLVLTILLLCHYLGFLG